MWYSLSVTCAGGFLQCPSLDHYSRTIVRINDISMEHRCFLINHHYPWLQEFSKREVKGYIVVNFPLEINTFQRNRSLNFNWLRSFMNFWLSCKIKHKLDSKPVSFWDKAFLHLPIVYSTGYIVVNFPLEINTFQRNRSLNSLPFFTRYCVCNSPMAFR
jgi:hypothetical protein